MTHFLKTLSVFVVFVALLLASLYGVVTSNTSPIAAVGTMQIAPHKQGLSLYQGYRGQYYTLSPFNDFFLDAKGARSTFISREEIDTLAYSSSQNKPKFAEIGEMVKGYLKLATPSIRFQARNFVGYTTRIDGNKLTITRTVKMEEQSRTQNLGMTLSYHGGDFVYDRSGNLYNYWNLEDISNFSQIYEKGFIPYHESNQVAIPDRKIFIVSRNLASVIVVKATPKQQLRVNRSSKFVEVLEAVTPTDGEYINSIEVEVYQDPKQIKEN